MCQNEYHSRDQIVKLMCVLEVDSNTLVLAQPEVIFKQLASTLGQVDVSHVQTLGVIFMGKDMSMETVYHRGLMLKLNMQTFRRIIHIPT